MLNAQWENIRHSVWERLRSLWQWIERLPSMVAVKLRALWQGVVTGALASSLKGTFKSMAGLALVFVVAGAAYFVLQAVTLHFAFPAHMIIVQPIELSEDTLKLLALNGRTASDIVVDELNTSVDNAMAFRGYQSKPSPYSARSGQQRPESNQLHYGSIRKFLKIPIQSSYGIEIKGVSLDTLVLIYNRIRYDIWEISGDLTGSDDSPAVSIRLSKNGSASQWYFPLSGSAQAKNAVVELLRDSADQVLEAWDPEIMTRAYLQEGKYSEAERTARSWSQADSSSSEPVYYIVQARLYQGLHCSENACTASDGTDPVLTDFEAALALAKWERQRLGEAGYLDRLASLRSRSIANNERDRLEDAIADIELTICADTSFEHCDSYLKDADDRYSKLMLEYRDDENVAVHFAAVKMLRNLGAQAMKILDDFEDNHVVDGTFYFSKAEAQKSMRNINGAVDAYREALTIDPSKVSSQVAFMNALTQRGSNQDSVEAVDTYRWLSTIAPLDPSSYPQIAIDLKIDYAWGLLRTGDLSAAATAVRSILASLAIPTLNQFAEAFREKKYTSPALEIIKDRIVMTKTREESREGLLALFTEAAKIESDLGNSKQATAYSKMATEAAKQRMGHAINFQLVPAPGVGP